MASRSTGIPGPGGYWLRPPSMASLAAASIPAGPSVSGKPWPRFTAPVRTASAVISAKIVEVNGRNLGTSAGTRTTPNLHGQWCRGATDGSRPGQATGPAQDETRRHGVLRGGDGGVPHRAVPGGRRRRVELRPRGRRGGHGRRAGRLVRRDRAV